MPKIRWVFIYAAISFALAVTAVTIYKEMARIDRLSDALEARMEEMVEISRRTQALQEKIAFYSSPAGIKYLAREEFNLVSSGEKIYRIEIISEDQLRNKQ